MLEQLNLKARFAIASTILFLAAMWLPLQYVIQSLGDSSQMQLEAELAADIEQMASNLSDQLRFRKGVLHAVAANVEQSWINQPEQLRTYLKRHDGLLPVFGMGLAIASPQGIVLADYPAIPGREGSDFSIYSSYQGVIQRGETTIGPPRRSDFSGSPVFGIATPILNSRKEKIGILSGAVDLSKETLVGHPGDIKQTGFSYFVIAPGQRQIVSASEPYWVLQPLFSELDELLTLSETTQGRQDRYISINGESYLASLRPVPNSPWLLLGLRRTSIAFGAFEQIKHQVLWFGLVQSLFMLLSVWYLVAYLLRPLDRFAKQLEKKAHAAAGQQSIEPEGPSEIRCIAGSYNELAAEIERQTRNHREEGERFRILADASPVLLLLSDTMGKTRWVNETWRAFSGKDATFADLIHPEERSEIIRLHKAYQAARLPYDTEFRLLRADGTYRWVHSRSIPVFDKNEEYIGGVMSCLDVTERKEEAEEQRQLLEENRKLVASIFHVIEQERQNIARDLHDDIGQWITAIRVNATSINRMLEAPPASVSQAVDAIGSCAISLHAAIRRMLQELRPSHMDTLELSDGLKEFVEQWTRAFPGTKCELDIAGDIPPTSTDVRITLYRIVQESLTNVARHSHAKRVLVRLSLNRGILPGDERLELEIEDDGIGFSQIQRHSGSLGLVGMRERVMAVQGKFDLRSLPEQGTRILVSVSPMVSSGSVNEQ